MNDIPQKPALTAKNPSPAWKLGLIGIIILVLMIPVAWISTLIHERYSRRDSVISEIASKWGSAQIVSGPFISVPYPVSVKEKDFNGKEMTIFQTRYLHITPETLNVTGKVQSIIQHRGIFKVPGYKAELDLTSSFPANIDISGMPEGTVLDWNNAIISFDLDDERGLKELTGEMNGTPLKFKKSANIIKVSRPVETEPKLKARETYIPDSEKNKEYCFKFEAKSPMDIRTGNSQIKIHLNLTGTQKLSFLTSAITETIKLTGDWLSPSFTGDILPDNRTVDAKGFTASWKTNYLNTGNKPSWTSDEPTIRLSSLGVNFLIMVDAYQQTTRTLKYSILFLMLTFMTFFFAETITKQRIHPIQYLMVGCSLILFYLLLLSISEHIGFGWSYLIAAFGVVMQISLYCYTILKTKKFALQVGSIITGVYAFLYILLRLEDSALLVGSISLFVLLGIAMYVIRNVNWYGQE